jgi:hypothetical protein
MPPQKSISDVVKLEQGSNFAIGKDKTGGEFTNVKQLFGQSVDPCVNKSLLKQILCQQSFWQLIGECQISGQ